MPVSPSIGSEFMGPKDKRFMLLMGVVKKSAFAKRLCHNMQIYPGYGLSGLTFLLWLEVLQWHHMLLNIYTKAWRCIAEPNWLNSIDRATIYFHHEQITNASTFDDLDCPDMKKDVERLCAMMIEEGIFIDTLGRVARILRVREGMGEGHITHKVRHCKWSCDAFAEGLGHLHDKAWIQHLERRMKHIHQYFIIREWSWKILMICIYNMQLGVSWKIKRVGV